MVLLPLAVGCQVMKLGPDKSTVRLLAVVVLVVVIVGTTQIVTAPVDVLIAVPVPAIRLVTPTAPVAPAGPVGP